MKSYSYLLAGVLCLLWVSCSSSPQTRIDKNPQLYSSLSPDQQAKVERGQIEQGLSKDGVFLAMGKPDKVTQGASKKGEYEQWNYYRMQPVMRHGFGGYWGLGSRGYGSRCGRYSGWGYSPSITYIPRKSAIVRFEGDQVDEYQLAGEGLY